MGTAKLGSKRRRPPPRFRARKHAQRKSSARKNLSRKQRRANLKKVMPLLNKKGRRQARKTLRRLKRKNEFHEAASVDGLRLIRARS